MTAGARPGTADGAVAVDALHQLLHAVSAVLLTGDSRPVPETAAWIRDSMATRGVDACAVGELGDLVVTALAAYPLARELVDTHFADGL